MTDSSHKEIFSASEERLYVLEREGKATVHIKGTGGALHKELLFLRPYIKYACVYDSASLSMTKDEASPRIPVSFDEFDGGLNLLAQQPELKQFNNEFPDGPTESILCAFPAGKQVGIRFSYVGDSASLERGILVPLNEAHSLMFNGYVDDPDSDQVFDFDQQAPAVLELQPHITFHGTLKQLVDELGNYDDQAMF